MAATKAGRRTIAVGKAVVGVMLVAIALVVGAWALAQSPWGRTKVRHALVARAQGALPSLQILSVARLSGNYWHTLQLEDVQLRDRTGMVVLRVGSMGVRYRLWSLLKKHIEIQSLLVDGVEVVAAQDDQGHWNLQDLIKPNSPKPATQAAAAWTLSVQRLQLQHVHAQVSTSSGATASISLELALSALLGPVEQHVKLDRAVFSSSELPGPISVSGTASGRWPTLQFAIEVAAGPSGHLSSDGILDFKSGQLGAYQATLTGRDLHLDSGQRSGLGQTTPEFPGNSITADFVRFSLLGSGVPGQPNSRLEAAADIKGLKTAEWVLEKGQVFAAAAGPFWHASARCLGSGLDASLKAHGMGPALVADVFVATPQLGDVPKTPVKGLGSLSAHVEGIAPAHLMIGARARGRNLRLLSTHVRTLDLTLDLGVDLTVNAKAGGAVADARAMSAIDGHLTLTAGGIRHTSQGQTVNLDVFRLRLRNKSGHLQADAHVAARGVLADIVAHGTATRERATVTIDKALLALSAPWPVQRVQIRPGAGIVWQRNRSVEVSNLVGQAQGAWASGVGTLSGRYQWPARRRESPSAAFVVSLKKAQWRSFDGVDVDASGSLDHHTAKVTLKAQAGTARLEGDASLPLAVGTEGMTLAKRGAIAIHLKTSGLTVQGLPILRKRLARQGLVNAAITLDAEVHGDVAQPDLHASVDLAQVEIRRVVGLGRDSSLRRIAGINGRLSLQTKVEEVRFDAQVAVAGAGSASATGSVHRSAGALLAHASDWKAVPVDGTLTVEPFDLAWLRQLDERFANTTGQLHATARLEGTVGQPHGSFDAQLANVKVDQLAFGPINCRVQADGRRVTAQLALAQVQGGRLQAQAQFDRLGTGAATLQAEAKATHIDPGFGRLFVSGVRELSGVVDVDASASGPLSDPKLAGHIYYYNGRVGIIGQPTFHDVGLALELGPGRVDIKKMHAFSGGGSITGSAWMTLAGLKPDHVVLTANAHRFVVAAAGSTGARLDGDLAVEGALRSSIVEGKVKVPQASVWLPKVSTSGKALQKISPHDDVRFIDEAALAAQERDQAQAQGATSPAAARVLDVNTVAGTVYVRGKDLDLEVESHLHVTGPVGASPVINGTVQIRRGYIKVSNQRFDFDRGNLLFDGSAVPKVDVRVTHVYPDATVAVEIRGTTEKPQLRLVSDPPIYDQGQMVSLVLTGQAGGQPSSGSFDATSAVATAVLGKIADKVAPELGLDVVRVEQVKQTDPEGAPTGQSDTRVEVGKYISPRVYLSYAHVFGVALNQNANEAQVEYHVSRRWLVETVFGDAGAGGLDALWSYRY